MTTTRNDLDFTGVSSDELRARMDRMGIQYPVWQAMEAELARRAAAKPPIRDIATIEAAIVGVNKLIDDVDAFLQDCRNTPCKGDEWVVGFPQYGRYVNRQGNLTSVTKCALYLDRSHTMGMRVVNGHGEVAQVVRYLDALDGVINTQVDLHAWLCGQYQDLLQELVDTRAYEADMDARAKREDDDWAEDLAAYHAQMDAREEWADRHDNWS